MDRGRFLVFEGVDGSGKTTLARRIAAELGERVGEVLYTWEPGYLRETRPFLEPVLAGEVEEGAFLLFLFDRYVHAKRVILPALEEGRWVVCDRYHLSTVVYQKVPYEKYMILHRTLSLPEPDLLVVLHGHGEGFWHRIDEPVGFEEKRRSEMTEMDTLYRELGEREGGLVLDGNEPIESLVKRVLNKVKERLL